MKPFFRKFFGILCIMMCVGDVIAFIGNVATRPEWAGKTIISSIIIFCLCAYGAWKLLSKTKNNSDNYVTRSVDNINHDLNEPVYVSALTSFLVYVVDVLIVITVWLLPSLLAKLFGASDDSTFWFNLLGILLGVATAILLPGPKQYQRMANKRKR